MAREESYKDFFVSCHSDEKPESVSGDSVKLSKGMRKTQDKMTKFCLRFSKLELKYGSFLLPVTQSIYKIMVWLNQVKNL